MYRRMVRMRVVARMYVLGIPLYHSSGALVFKIVEVYEILLLCFTVETNPLFLCSCCAYCKVDTFLFLFFLSYVVTLLQYWTGS